MQLENAQPVAMKEKPDGPFASTPNIIEQLPMLRVAFERMAGACAEGLRGATVVPLQVELVNIEGGPAGEILAPLEGVSATGVLHAPKWDSRLLAAADRPAMFTLIEMLLGGDGSQPAYAAERSLSKLEIKVAGTFFQRVAQALSASFSSIADTPIVVDASADRFDFDAIGGRSSPVVAARLRVECRDRGGDFAVAIPKSVLAPMRQALSRPPPKAAAKPDPRWSQRIQNEITRTNVGLRAVLDERWISLEEVSSLKVGQVLRLNATPTSRVRVECNDEPLLWCQLGKSNGVYTLRVDEHIDREQEFLDDILFG